MIVVCERTTGPKEIQRWQPPAGWYQVAGALQIARTRRQAGTTVWIEDTDAPATEVSRQYHARWKLRWLPPVDPGRAQ